MINKRLINTGEAAPAPVDPLQNFETVTYTGNGSTQKITGYIRKGAAFNGSTSKIDLGDVDFFQGDFSISLFFNPVTNTGTDFQVIGIKRDNAVGDGTLEISLMLREGNNPTAPKTVLFAIGGGGTNYNVLLSSNTYNFDSWNHLTAKISGTAMSITLNGTETTGTFLGTRQIISSEFRIGNKYGVDNDYPFNGKLDQVRIFNTALTPEQVGELALETYADPKKSTTDYFGDGSGVALYELDDNSLSSNFKQAAVFNGTSSYISGMPSISNAGGSSSSVSVWFKSNSIPSANEHIFSGIQEKVTDDPLFSIFINTSGHLVYEFRAVTPEVFIIDTTNYCDGNWHNAVATIDSSNMRLYIDGQESNSSPNSAFSGTMTIDNCVIGARNLRGTIQLYFNGLIDQVRIFNTALGQADVTKLYQESSTIPTANLVAHYKLDGDATDALDTYNGVATAVTYSNGVYGGTATNVNYLGMAFQPDLVWIKSRSNPSWHSLQDSVRGATKTLFSNETSQEITYSDAQTSFDANGFTLGADASGGSVNLSGRTYVAWCWKAGGAAVTNTDGTITSQVSANPAAGFSIVSYTDNGSGGRVGHGLGVAPSVIIEKRRDSTSNWVYLTELSTGWELGLLNGTGAFTTNFTFYDGANAPNDTTFRVGNPSGANMIAYCFADVPGYQKVGRYTGTGASGNTITTGFRPRFILLRRSNTVNNWDIFDSTRDSSTYVSKTLKANSTDAEFTYPQGIYFQDNGFEPENTYFNDSGDTIIYLAIA